METKKRTTQKMDLLSAVEKVVELSKGSHLDAEFFKKATRPLKHIADKLELTKEQSVMMALFIDNSNGRRISISDFARHFDCSMTKIIRFMNDIDVLEQRGMVCCSRSNREISYRVPLEVIEAFKRNEKFIPKDHSGISCDELFGLIAEIMEMRNDDEMSTEMAMNQLQELFEKNGHLVFVQKLKSYCFAQCDEALLVLFAHLFVNNSEDNIGFSDLEFFFDSKALWSIVKRRLNNNVSDLQYEKLIEYHNDNGLVDRESFHLTLNAKMSLLSELNISILNIDNNRNSLIHHEDITSKQLFYDHCLAGQVNDLGQLLEESHYKEVCNRMKEKGFRTGFTCLFYGAPGTGKTETVLQLARQTGRNIMQVNVSEIKSMWVGESEKNIKNVFDQYRMIVEKASVAPILLFNEADAIIGKRQEGAERAVEKMENSIQNIILQEMENLNGILIATTNLAQNMDKAFERRFLYKIKFNKPTLEARIQIWQSMLPELHGTDIKALAEKYDLSGGQIENVARHYAIDTVLHGNASLETLMEHCDSEHLEQKQRQKIGFT